MSCAKPSNATHSDSRSVGTRTVASAIPDSFPERSSTYGITPQFAHFERENGSDRGVHTAFTRALDVWRSNPAVEWCAAGPRARMVRSGPLKVRGAAGGIRGEEVS